ncbi:hypothetical protein LSO9J_260001 [Candidatus Liberibacter solanacearum]
MEKIRQDYESGIIQSLGQVKGSLESCDCRYLFYYFTTA